jgi:hypothetical protein
VPVDDEHPDPKVVVAHRLSPVLRAGPARSPPIEYVVDTARSVASRSAALTRI